MTVSVIMAVYNGMKYIGEQLDSLKNQQREADEVIIIDDCSADETYNIVNKYIQKNGLETWKLYKNDKNKGYIANFKNGLSLCQGDIIFTCDQDDIWNPDKIKKMIEVMEDDKKILLLASSLCFIDGEGRILEQEYIPYGLNKTPRDSVQYISFIQVLEKNFFPGCTMAVRRSLVEAYCHNECTDISHDWAMAMMAAGKEGLAWLNTELTEYRIHGGNTLGLAASCSWKEYIAQIISTWGKYCEEFQKRMGYTEAYINLNKKDKISLQKMKKFPTYRMCVVFHYDFFNNKKRLSILKCVRYYMCELKEYFVNVKGKVDIRGLAIDFIYIFKPSQSSKS